MLAILAAWMSGNKSVSYMSLREHPPLNIAPDIHVHPKSDRRQDLRTTAICEPRERTLSQREATNSECSGDEATNQLVPRGHPSASIADPELV